MVTLSGIRNQGTYVSETSPPFKSTDSQIRVEHNQATDRLLDPKWEGLTAPLQGYSDIRGKTPSLWSGRVSLIGKKAQTRR